MREFLIRLGSVREVQEFVSIATTRSFAITVRDEHNKIRAESFMELFCLDFSHPLRVVCDCDEQQLNDFRMELQRFLAD